MKKISFLILLAAILLASCNTGDSNNSYSYMVQDLVDVYATNPKTISYAISDDGVKIVFSNPQTMDWMEKTDSAYRAFVQCTVSSDQPSSTYTTATLTGIAEALVFEPKTPAEAAAWSDKKDRVTLTSAWMGSSKTYLNLQLYFPASGAEFSSMFFDVVEDSVSTIDGKTTHFIRLCHDGNGATDTYSQTVFASIPLDNITSGEVIRLGIPDGSGYVYKDYEK